MTKKVTVPEYLSSQMGICGKSQKQIAEEVGFPAPNMLTMIKQGTTRVPITRVNALADSLGVQRSKLMRMVLEENHPEMLSAIEEAFSVSLK